MLKKFTPMPSSNKSSVILGLDPGWRAIGFGLISFETGSFHYIDSGTWQTDGRGEPHLAIQKSLHELIRKYRPQKVFVEKLYFQKNAKSAMHVAQILGVILSEVARANIRVLELSPTRIKKNICGHGQAEKEGIRRMVQLILKSPLPHGSHAADALAIAIAGCLEKRYQHLTTSGSVSNNRGESEKSTFKRSQTQNDIDNFDERTPSFGKSR